MNAEDAAVPRAVALAAERSPPRSTRSSERLDDGGRLIYVGAGTSGRLALVDAAECQSTFAVAARARDRADRRRRAQRGHRAGAGRGRRRRRRRASCSELAGRPDRRRRRHQRERSHAVRARSARGGRERRERSRSRIVSVEESELGRIADHEIAVVVGPEIIAGSTRLKAGTAQKLVLNMISTIAMVRIGKTFGNLMVDVVATNDKLRARVRRIVAHASGSSPAEVEAALDAAGRRRQGGDRVAARRSRRGGRTRAPRSRPRDRPAGARTMRLGVEAALVAGRLVPGDVAFDGDRIEAVGLDGGGRGIAVARLRRPPGQRIRRRRLPRARTRMDTRRRPRRCSRPASRRSCRPSSPRIPTSSSRRSHRFPTHSTGPAHPRSVISKGPFLSPARLGTHPAGARRDPDAALLERLLVVRAGPD